MDTEPTCGAGFTVMSSGPFYDGDHRCIKPRLHLDGPHEDAVGFMWGMKDQTVDVWHKQLVDYDRKLIEKRKKAANRWYRKLADRGYVKPSQRASG